MAYPCPLCGTATRVRTSSHIKGKQVPVVKRTCRCKNPECDAQFTTAEFVCGPVAVHYGLIKEEKETNKPAKDVSERRQTPKILIALLCPHCNGSNTHIQSTEWNMAGDTYIRYHGCKDCSEHFYTYTSDRTNSTSIHKKILPKED